MVQDHCHNISVLLVLYFIWSDAGRDFISVLLHYVDPNTYLYIYIGTTLVNIYHILKLHQVRITQSPVHQTVMISVGSCYTDLG